MAQLHTGRSDSSSQRPWTTYTHYLSIHKQDLCKHILSVHAGTHSCQMDSPLSPSAPPDFGAAAFFSLSLSLSLHTILFQPEKSPRAIYLAHRLSPCIHPDLCTACFFTPSTAVFQLAAARTVSNYITIYRCVPLRCCCCCCCCRFHTISRANYTRQLRWFAELHQHRLASVSTLYAC